MEQQQVLACQLAFLLCVPPRGSAQLGVFCPEPRHGGSQVDSGAGAAGSHRDLVEDATVRGIERVSAAPRLPRDRGRADAHGASGEGRVRRLALDQPVERSAVGPRGVFSLRRCLARARPALLGMALLGCHPGSPRCV